MTADEIRRLFESCEPEHRIATATALARSDFPATLTAIETFCALPLEHGFSHLNDLLTGTLIAKGDACDVMEIIRAAARGCTLELPVPYLALWVRGTVIALLGGQTASKGVLIALGVLSEEGAKAMIGSHHK